MITIDTSSKKLCVVLGEGRDTEHCSVVVSYIDRVLKYSGQQGSLNSYVPYTIESEFDVEQTTPTNGTTVVDVVPSPNQSNDVWKYTHNVRTISIFNHDTIAHTVTVSMFDSVYFPIVKFTIDPSTTIFYDNNGWYIKNSAGIEPAPGTGTFVPYTGATADVNLGEFQLLAGQITLDTSPSGTAVVGTTAWNNTIGSSETTLKGGNVILKNGVDLVARIVNKVVPNTTLTKAAYQAVKVSGATGQRLSVDLARANIDLNSADTIGIVTETIATNQEGFIITVGTLSEINTTGSLQGETWADGDVLYLSPTTAGSLTNIKPTGATGHIVVMGYIEYSHAVHGSIYVKIMNGWELDELHNVYINSVANNDILTYESSSQLWNNKSVSTALGYTPVNKAGDTMSGYLILNADPVNSLGATTKDYVDNLINGIDWKSSARAATLVALPSYVVSGSGQILTGSVNGAIPSATTDGVTLVATNRVLVKDETGLLTPNNGIYTVTQAGNGSTKFILTRSSDANTSNLLAEATVSIASGSTLSNTQWHCNPASVPITIGSTNITFAQIGSGVYLGTAPINISGNTISIAQSNGSTNGYLSSTDWTTFNGKGTVTSVSALTIGTTGTDLASTVATGTSTPVITLNVPTASATNRGALSSADWTTFNGKGNGTVTSVAALTIGTSGTDLASTVATGTTTPVITLNVPTASASNRGALSSTDWSTFNNKSRVQFNNSTATQAITAATVTYLTGSNITTANIKAGTVVIWTVSVTKTAAGTVAPLFSVRFGTASSTADAIILNFTGNAQTAIADTGEVTIQCTFRTVGSGTSAVLVGHYKLVHVLPTTGLSTGQGGVFTTSAGFDSTTASAFLGLTLNTGASSAWTVNQVNVKIENIS